MSVKLYTDPQGNEVPAKYINKYDKVRDKIANDILGDWIKGQEYLRKLKKRTEDRIEKMRAMAAAETGVTLGGKKGNLSFRSFDGSVTIMLDAQQRTEFDERLSMAQQLIQEAVTEITKDAGNADLAEIANRAFQPRKSGNLDMARIRALKTYKVSHPKWKKACEIISECERVVGSRQYIRVLVRKHQDAKPESVLLDLAAID